MPVRRPRWPTAVSAAFEAYGGPRPQLRAELDEPPRPPIGEFYSSYEETSLPGDFDPNNNNFITSELCVSDTGVSAWVGERARRLRAARQA